MPAITCPFCRAFANFTQVHIFDSHVDGAPVRFVVWTCNACGNPVTGRPGPAGEVANYYPRSLSDESFPDVPPQIAADAREAIRCFDIDAWRASAAMARRALQAAAYEKGAPDATLVEQIDWLAANGHVTEQMKDVAHQIRLAGNLGAHPDRDGLRDLGQDDAAAIIAFLRDFFRFVYEIPASLSKLAARPPEQGAP